jgi:hypothetical protein
MQRSKNTCCIAIFPEQERGNSWSEPNQNRDGSVVRKLRCAALWPRSPAAFHCSIGSATPRRQPLARSRNGLPINMDHADCDVTLTQIRSRGGMSAWMLFPERLRPSSLNLLAKPSATPAETRNVSESGAECVPFWVPQPDAAPQLQPYLLD